MMAAGRGGMGVLYSKTGHSAIVSARLGHKQAQAVPAQVLKVIYFSYLFLPLWNSVLLLR